MKSPRHLRLIACDAQPSAPADSRAADAPAAKRARKQPPLRPARASSSIRAGLRRLIAAQSATIDQCIASVNVDGSGAVLKLEQQQRAIATQVAALRESLRREHNGMRWKKGLSYDEN